MKNEEVIEKETVRDWIDELGWTVKLNTDPKVRFNYTVNAHGSNVNVFGDNKGFIAVACSTGFGGALMVNDLNGQKMFGILNKGSEMQDHFLHQILLHAPDNVNVVFQQNPQIPFSYIFERCIFKNDIQLFYDAVMSVIRARQKLLTIMHEMIKLEQNVVSQ